MNYIAVILAYAIGCLNVLPLAMGYISKHEAAAHHRGFQAGKLEGLREAESRMDNGANCFISAYWAEGVQKAGVVCIQNGRTQVLGRDGV